MLVFFAGRNKKKVLFIGSIILGCVFFTLCFAHVLDQELVPLASGIKKYNFSRDWFSRNMSLWSETLAGFKGKENIRYLEIGVYEGFSLIWMLENILIHATARVTCIDIFPDNLEQIFLSNLGLSGFADKVTIINGKSLLELRRLPFDFYDIIYVDASHTADNVLSDVMLCWPLLKSGGLLIFDDYLLDMELQPEEFRPKVAIDAFITSYRNYLEIVHRGYQLIVRKRKINIPASIHVFDADYFISLGEYVYFLRDRQLFHSRTKEPVELLEEEKLLLDKLAWMRKFGETEFSPDIEMSNDNDYIELMKKIFSKK